MYLPVYLGDSGSELLLFEVDWLEAARVLLFSFAPPYPYQLSNSFIVLSAYFYPTTTKNILNEFISDIFNGEILRGDPHFLFGKISIVVLWRNEWRQKKPQIF